MPDTTITTAEVLRFLADARAEYDRGDDNDYLSGQINAARTLAEIVAGTNDAQGWLPSWRWAEFAKLMESYSPDAETCPECGDRRGWRIEPNPADGEPMQVQCRTCAERSDVEPARTEPTEEHVRALSKHMHDTIGCDLSGVCKCTDPADWFLLEAREILRRYSLPLRCAPSANEIRRTIASARIDGDVVEAIQKLYAEQPQRCAPDRDAIVHLLFDQVTDDWDENDIGILADAIVELIAAQPTVEEAKHDFWDEGVRHAADSLGWEPDDEVWGQNPYRSEADHG